MTKNENIAVVFIVKVAPEKQLFTTNKSVL